MIGVGLASTLSGGKRIRTNLDPMPALDLNFAANRSLPADYGPTPSFSRASSGTYFDSSGTLQTVSTNAPRFDHVYSGGSWISRGLLLEEQRTNALTYSRNLTNAAWTKNTTTAASNAANGPSGTGTATALSETSAAGYHSANRTGLSTSGTQTASLYAKANGRNYISIEIVDNYRAVINLSDGSVVSNTLAGSTLTTESIGNGWYRIKYTATGSVERFIIYLLNSSTFGSYTGDGSSGILVDCCQLEAGSFATSYIPTTSASATRSADVCQITGSDFSSFWNATEGSIVAEFDYQGTIFGGAIRVAESVSGNQSVSFSTNGSNLNVEVYSATNGGTQASFTASPLAVGALNKIASAFAANNFAASFNGATVLTDTSGAMPVNPVAAYIGNPGGVWINGHITRLRYYPSRLTNAKLQELST